MKRVLVGCVIVVLATISIAGTAPEQINYQAKVEVQGVPFDGVGQFKFAIVDEGGAKTYWSNDGTSVAGGEPTNQVVLNVKGGLLNLMLGDESHPNMTLIPASVFTNPDTWYRVWFGGSDGSTFERLSPDTKMASVPYALMAETVPDDSLSGKKLMRESVWPVHAGRDNTIVSYYAEYTEATMVNVGTISSNKNFIITDIVVGASAYTENAYSVEIKYTKDTVDTVLFKVYTLSTGGTIWHPYKPTHWTFRSGLVVPAGATLKIGGCILPGPNPQNCTVSGFEISVE